ncbi:MAG: methyltransferase domain-containing protein [Bacteroidales bacterium]|nr:methyltransferase domain-containing protein [Bacteroidales bacterium]
MKYDPVKNRIGRIVSRSVLLRKIFYSLLDILLLRAWHVRKILKRFASENVNARNILDAGSGFGQYAWRIWKINKKWNVLGIEIKEEQVHDCNSFISKTKAAAKVSFMLADLTVYREDNHYDLILSVDVMEHIEDDIAVFENFYTSMRRGGWLVISSPSDRGGSDVHADGDRSFIDEHVRDGYGMDEIRQKLESAGFSKIQASYTYGRPGSLSWMISMKYPVLMLNFSGILAILLPFYYILVMPLVLILNYLDVRLNHDEGTGLLVVAKK